MWLNELELDRYHSFQAYKNREKEKERTKWT